ncbi:MAG: ADP-ribosylglycohydrolase family protein [Spirochaetota bacterium]
MSLYLLKSGIYGVCVGDAFGLPMQFKTRKYMEENPISNMTDLKSLSIPKGTWSDDSSLTLCLAESLSRGFDLSDISQNFIKWYEEGFLTPDNKAFDVGNTTEKAMTKLKNGILPENSGGQKVEDNGNGSLMRILPLSFYLSLKETNEDVYYDQIRLISSITHAHGISIIACSIYIDFAIQLIHGNSIKEAYVGICRKQKKYFEISDTIGVENYSRILNGNLSEEKRADINSSRYVVESLEAALWCLLTSNNYEETILKAVHLGDDTDTVAAIAGGLAGLYYGFDTIPKQWLEDLRKKDIIDKVCEKFSNYLYDEHD